MKFALEERIGSPELFVGRNKELEFFLNWIDNIKLRKSQSTAILARRKMGKTALMERLFNITFSKNNGVIPFYYEIKERKMWVMDFCQDLFLTFIYQYIAFKSRKPAYLRLEYMSDFRRAVEIAKQEELPYLCNIIEDAANAVANERTGILWEIVREAPKKIASMQNEPIVQMIDEFQFLNSKIYRDKELQNLADDLAGGYLSTAESKIAPLLVSGSWVGWLMNLLGIMLPARFRHKFLGNMPQDEAIEMIYKYSQFFDVSVTEETAYLLAQLSEGSPFYISSVLQSGSHEKNLTTIQGLTETLEFETLDDRGTIKFTWMEYVNAAFNAVNNRNAKRIVLHLFKNKDRELTRKELLDQLQLDMTDEELEKKLEALLRADIINRGQTHFDYRCVQDNIFDKVFRGVYQKEIEHFEITEIKKEYSQALEELKRQYRRLLGKYNYHKGYFAEYLILDQLRLHAQRKNDLLKSITRHLPLDFHFSEYSYVWKYDFAPKYSKSFNIDIFARSAAPGDYWIIGEVKSREVKKFSQEEAVEFERKFDEIKTLEKIERAVGFIFSRSGFTKEAEDYCRERGIAISDDERWLGD